ncbi:MAG: hypothetical protein V4726_12185 [Verrucomicrobiota bacterium]
MISLTQPSFWRLYEGLPSSARDQARNAFTIFSQSPFHPGLQFKKLAGSRPWWSVRIGLNYRAVGIREGETIRWFWIGSHADYDRLLGC